MSDAAETDRAAVAGQRVVVTGASSGIRVNDLRPGIIPSELRGLTEARSAPGSRPASRTRSRR